MFVWWYTPSILPPPRERPCRDWGYFKMKMKITIQIPIMKIIELMNHMFL